MNSDPLYEQAIRDIERLESDNAMLQARVREVEGQVRWLESQERNYEACNADLYNRLSRAEATITQVTEERELWRRAGIREEESRKSAEATVERLREALPFLAEWIKTHNPNFPTVECHCDLCVEGGEAYNAALAASGGEGKT